MTAPSLDALARLAAAAQAMADAATAGPWRVEHGRTYDTTTGAVASTEAFVRRPDDDVAIAADIVDPATGLHSDANAALIAAAPDLARGLVAAVDALRAERAARATAERERDAYRTDALRLAAANGRLADDADAAQRGRRAAEAQRDALAAAVREERAAREDYDAALAAGRCIDRDAPREERVAAATVIDRAGNRFSRANLALSDLLRVAVVRAEGGE